MRPESAREYPFYRGGRRVRDGKILQSSERAARPAAGWLAPSSSRATSGSPYPSAGGFRRSPGPSKRGPVSPPVRSRAPSQLPQSLRGGASSLNPAAPASSPCILLDAPAVFHSVSGRRPDNRAPPDHCSRGGLAVFVLEDVAHATGSTPGGPCVSWRRGARDPSGRRFARSFHLLVFCERAKIPAAWPRPDAGDDVVRSRPSTSMPCRLFPRRDPEARTITGRWRPDDAADEYACLRRSHPVANRLVGGALTSSSAGDPR